MSEVSSATIQERLDQLAVEQARREREIAEHTVALGDLDRQRAAADVAAQLDGQDRSTELKDVTKRRAAATETLDRLTGERARGELERAELARRHAEAQCAELLAEHARIGEELARLDTRAAEHVMAMSALHREAQQLQYTDTDLANSPLLVSGPKGRPIIRATASFAVGVLLHPSVVAQAESLLAGRGRNGEVAA